MPDLIVIGGGLAGSEAAWQAAQAGTRVDLFEMRPFKETGAHATGYLAELVCSNSLGSTLPDRASGVLKEELRRFKSLLLACAEETALPAGGALAVDREGFAKLVTERLESHPNIRILHEEVKKIPAGPVIIATGPLTSHSLSKAIGEITGEQHLYFYDAIAPIVSVESINFDLAYRGSRYGRGAQREGDYINCPFSKEQYSHFIGALVAAERIELKQFESKMTGGVKAGEGQFFEGCLPIEILASREKDALAFGPLRPVGLTNPHTGKGDYAVLQLRQDNLAGTLYNMVGFQTNLKYAEQKRVFRMIPGLEQGEFIRYGQMHRNTFIFSPDYLKPSLQFTSRDDLFFAGQITGVEGYLGNIATGLLAGLNVVRVLQGRSPYILPQETMLGALCYYVTHAAAADFQPMKANFGILPQLDLEIRGRRPRALAYASRAKGALDQFLASRNDG